MLFITMTSVAGIINRAFILISYILFSIYTRMQKCNHISSCLLNKLPGLSEVWACHGWANFFKSWGRFLQNISLTLCKFLKKNLIWNVLWNVWNFGYYIKNNFLCNTQSFRHSSAHVRWNFLVKIGLLRAKGITKNVFWFEVGGSIPNPSILLRIRVVCEVVI